MTAVLCAKFQNDSGARYEVVDKQVFVRFHISDRLSIM